MAKIDFILQAVTPSNHADAIRALLSIPNPNEALISVAFVRETGLDALEEAIKPIAEHAVFFVGIRNDITSIQAIKRLLTMKVKLYAVDTGSRNTLFHPKLYFAANNKNAGVIIGSANLTFGGLHNNIEVSTFMRLCLSDPTDKKFANDATSAFAEMLKAHPQHVFLVRDETHADELFESGRLADENIVPAPSAPSGVKKGERDDLPRMKLIRNVRPRIKTPVAKAAAPHIEVPVEPDVREEIPPVVTVASKYLVWESKELSRRDLNIPTGTTTNRTGSIGLGKGSMTGIDHRHYFRDVVFDGLTWVVDESKPHLEKSEANFEVVIKNLNYGVFRMTVRHNSDTSSISYGQKNEMTHLRWGSIKDLVAKEDLLERKLYLYRKDTNPPEFTIEID